MASKRKEERHTYVRKRSIELAQSGDYSDWLSIEWAIRNEGYEEARSLLDDKYTRDELDRICEAARSEVEQSNRALFVKWIQDYVTPTFASIEHEFPNVKLSTENSSFLIYGDKNDLRVSKSFGSRRLVGVFCFTETDGHRYKTELYDLPNKPFDEFSVEDLRGLVIRVISKYH